MIPRSGFPCSTNASRHVATDERLGAVMKGLFRIGFCGLVAALLALGAVPRRPRSPRRCLGTRNTRRARAKDKWCIDDAARAQTADCMNAAQAFKRRRRRPRTTPTRSTGHRNRRSRNTRKSLGATKNMGIATAFENKINVILNLWVNATSAAFAGASSRSPSPASLCTSRSWAGRSCAARRGPAA